MSTCKMYTAGGGGVSSSSSSSRCHIMHITLQHSHFNIYSVPLFRYVLMVKTGKVLLHEDISCA